MRVVVSELCLEHNPPYEVLSGQLQAYYESPDRIERILTALTTAPSQTEPDDEPNTAHYDIVRFDNWTAGDVVTDRQLATYVKQVHDADYLDYLRTVYGQWVNEGGNPTWVAALASARLCIEATRMLLEPESDLPVAFALCRPPGHHATPGLCGGYCYINNVAVAAKFLVGSWSERKPKVAILDIDAHHGNGTSKIFYDDPDTLYVSLHASPDYPYYTGSTAERGGPQALGLNQNYPLPLKTDNLLYISTLSTAVGEIKRWKPDFLFVSLGVDTYCEDPITDFEITLEAYPEMGSMIAQINVKTCFVMEGGYSAEIGQCVKGVLDGYQKASKKSRA
ncbi:hypothetical protein OIV83_002763 [Microbotryomycetes sp. JL201]|nr:hypothetical protein OIV83_002763 [Microbotryomycetes sp. JL201]